MEASQLPGCVCVCCLLRGMEASQLPGWVCVVFCGEWRRVSFRGAKGMGASQLWSWVLLLSTFFFLGAGLSQLPGGEGGWGESALELGVVVVYFLFLGANEYWLAQ